LRRTDGSATNSVVLWVILSRGDFNLAVVTTHFKAKESSEALETRKQQAQDLAKVENIYINRLTLFLCNIF